jgi:hypothetical protein
LEKIASYRQRLIEQNKVDKSKSSILIIVGRDDTGELEAQIRGSKYAWDIRIISTDALITKQHPAFNNQFDARYWFAFHPHQDAFLSKYQNAYACYGCGDEKHVFMLPLSFLKPKLNDMWKTKNEEKDYKHIVIFRKNGKYFLRTNINEKEHYDDLSQFAI